MFLFCDQLDSECLDVYIRLWEFQNYKKRLEGSHVLPTLR